MKFTYLILFFNLKCSRKFKNKAFYSLQTRAPCATDLFNKYKTVAFIENNNCFTHGVLNILEAV